MSAHQAREPEAEPGEQDQERESQDVGPHEREHAAEHGPRRDLGQERPQDEHVHPDRRADEADLDHAHDDDPEPDRVVPEVHDHREEDRHREEHHRELLFHKGSEKEDVRI